MFENTLSSEIERHLREVAPVVDGEEFCLAGGTGLALQVGHRNSEDLDVFKKELFGANP